MADPQTVFESFLVAPIEGATWVNLIPMIRFNCDLADSLVRSNYQENRYNMRFIVNAETVYESPSGLGNYWDESAGGSRHAYPSEGDNVRTPQHSVAIWYTLTPGQGSLTWNQTYRVAVELKYYSDEEWTEVVHADFTTAPDLPTDPAEPPVNPTPEADAVDVDSDLDLVSWEDGGAETSAAAASYHVYFAPMESPGWDYDWVTTEPLSSLSDQDVVILPETEYAWYVQALNDIGNADSDIWSFTTGEAPIPPSPMPEKAVNPSPVNSATGINFNQATLSWTDGGTGEHAATSFAVYIGLHNDESMVCVASGVATSVPINTLMIPTLFYWRVDSTNENGTTSGDTWTFTVDEDPIRNKQDDGAWHPGGVYTVEVYSPDTHVSLILSDNNSLDATGEIQGVTFGVLRRLDSQWAIYNVTIPFDCETGDLRLKWNYNDE